MPDAPDLFLSTTFADGEKVDNTKLFERILEPINQLIQCVQGLPQGYLGGDSALDPVALATGDPFAASASATFTIESTRRIRIAVGCAFTAASDGLAKFSVKAGCVAGSSPDLTGVTAGVAMRCSTQLTDESEFASAEMAVILDAGTYTAFAIAARISGGSSSDTATNNYVSVFDEGVA